MPLMLSVLLCLTGCGSDDGAPLDYTTDIVTFSGNGQSGATFTLIRQNSESGIPLEARNVKVDTASVKPGARVLMVYTRLTDTEIKIRSLQRIYNEKVSLGAYDNWNHDAIYMLSVWRTGSYINLECRVEYTDNPRRFYLAVNPLTLHDEIPELYVVHDKGDAAPSFMRRMYASWDMKSVWSLPTCRGVKVHMHDSNRNITEMTFMK